MMKSLYITSLKVPLLNALNIKLNMKKDEHADLLLENDLPDIMQIAQRIEELNIFDNVYIFENKPIDGIKRYIKKQTQKSITECIYNTFNEIYYKIRSNFSKEYKFKNKIIYNRSVDLSSYDKVYLCSFSEFVFNCIDIIECRNLQEINLIEGSIYDYLFNVSSLFNKKYPRIKTNFYLYDIDLIVWNNSKKIKLYNIKKLDWRNRDFVKYINYIFNVPDNLDDINTSIIFFDQVTEPMPLYLKNSSYLKKIVLHNAYKKHKIEDEFFQDKCKIFDIVYNSLKECKYRLDCLNIKLHPRTKNGIPEKYHEFKFIGDINNKNNIPWELYILNNKIKNSTLITMFSTSILSEMYNFNNLKSNNKFILLYNLFDVQKYTDNKKELDKFVLKLNKNYKSLYIVNNISDFNNVLLNK